MKIYLNDKGTVLMCEELKNGMIYCSFENNGLVFQKKLSKNEFEEILKNKNYILTK